jgi:pantothenate kinase
MHILKAECTRLMPFTNSVRIAVVFLIYLSSHSGAFPSLVLPMKDGLKKTWEQEAASHIRSMLRQRDDGVPSAPFLVSISGIPGSGKSTGAAILGNLLRDFAGTLVVPHDGYHYPLVKLRQLVDAEAAIYRRGAPDTFDAVALLTDLRRIRFGEEKTILLPGFDHAVGDPEEGTHQFCRNEHTIVICEGLYLLHNHDGWEDVAQYFDLNIYIDADVDKCMERLKVRNACIPGYTPEQISIRVDAIDRKNALTVTKSKERANLVYQATTF